VSWPDGFDFIAYLIKDADFKASTTEAMSNLSDRVSKLEDVQDERDERVTDLRIKVAKWAVIGGLVLSVLTAVLTALVSSLLGA
jgi:hypothetical protein